MSFDLIGYLSPKVKKQLLLSIRLWTLMIKKYREAKTFYNHRKRQPLIAKGIFKYLNRQKLKIYTKHKSSHTAPCSNSFKQEILTLSKHPASLPRWVFTCQM